METFVMLTFAVCVVWGLVECMQDNGKFGATPAAFFGGVLVLAFVARAVGG